jgi:hypothetical protein
MSDPIAAPELPAGHDAVSGRPLRPDEAQALLRACYDPFSKRLFEAARTSLDLAGDLFESNSAVPDGEVETFRSKRGEWTTRFERAIAEGFERRLGGQRRRGRRPDVDASAATLRVLTPFDHEKQAALVAATAFLHRFTKREHDALEERVRVLLPGAARERDDPFGPDYILDALGPTSRAIYPNPRVWRPLMERVLADITPAINKIYISLNRLLADRGVLPEIKAALRARSEWRPADDKDLLPTFSRMLAEAGDLPTDLVVPAASTAGGGSPLSAAAEPSAVPGTGAGGVPVEAGSIVPPGAAPLPAGPAFVSPEILAGLAALAELGARAGSARAGAGGAMAISGADRGDFPDLDPMMALGSSTPLFATLGHWQRLDLPAAIAQTMPLPADGARATAVPLNLVPHIRAAVTGQVANPADRIALDVIALLFDYIFRDPSIPDPQRRLFGRLQVPIVKAALLDRTFFSDRQHPARKLLDHLAEAAIGATTNAAYGDAFEAAAALVVDGVCRDFEIDVAVFERADAALQAFVDAERRGAAPALSDNVAEALASEESQADRSQVRALVRDRLAGLDLPFDMRSFAETVWADYLTALRKENGPESEAGHGALRTLDDLLWSIVVKERTAQKARLTKMIPGLISGLRRGCAAQAVPAERAKSFFDALYGLHMAALKPAPEPPPDAQRAAPAGQPQVVTQPEAEAVTGASVAPGANAWPQANVHDFVSEMAVGTWLAFGSGAEAVNARLSWVSPLRTKYILTSRSRTQAFVFSPEELAWELGTGRAALVVEPVPLWDRAVSAALDTLAAKRPPADAAAAAA